MGKSKLSFPHTEEQDTHGDYFAPLEPVSRFIDPSDCRISSKTQSGVSKFVVYNDSVVDHTIALYRCRHLALSAMGWID